MKRRTSQLLAWMGRLVCDSIQQLGEKSRVAVQRNVYWYQGVWNKIISAS
jgi:hypothetical protein